VSADVETCWKPAVEFVEVFYRTGYPILKQSRFVRPVGFPVGFQSDLEVDEISCKDEKLKCDLFERYGRGTNAMDIAGHLGILCSIHLSYGGIHYIR